MWFLGRFKTQKIRSVAKGAEPYISHFEIRQSNISHFENFEGAKPDTLHFAGAKPDTSHFAGAKPDTSQFRTPDTPPPDTLR